MSDIANQEETLLETYDLLLTESRPDFRPLVRQLASEHALLLRRCAELESRRSVLEERIERRLGRV